MEYLSEEENDEKHEEEDEENDQQDLDFKLLKKTKWTVEEDSILHDGVLKNGPFNWAGIATELPGRSAKQCRERWHNHMNNGLKKGEWTKEEDKTIISYQENLGNQWSKMTKLLPGRSDNDIKNRFHVLRRALNRGKLSVLKSDDNEIIDLKPVPRLSSRSMKKMMTQLKREGKKANKSNSALSVHDTSNYSDNASDSDLNSTLHTHRSLNHSSVVANENETTESSSLPDKIKNNRKRSNTFDSEAFEQDLFIAQSLTSLQHNSNTAASSIIDEDVTNNNNHGNKIGKKSHLSTFTKNSKHVNTNSTSVPITVPTFKSQQNNNHKTNKSPGSGIAMLQPKNNIMNTRVPTPPSPQIVEYGGTSGASAYPYWGGYEMYEMPLSGGGPEENTSIHNMKLNSSNGGIASLHHPAMMMNMHHQQQQIGSNFPNMLLMNNGHNIHTNPNYWYGHGHPMMMVDNNSHNISNSIHMQTESDEVENDPTITQISTSVIATDDDDDTEQQPPSIQMPKPRRSPPLASFTTAYDSQNVAQVHNNSQNHNHPNTNLNAGFPHSLKRHSTTPPAIEAMRMSAMYGSTGHPLYPPYSLTGNGYGLNSTSKNSLPMTSASVLAAANIMRKMATPSPGLDEDVLNYLASAAHEELNNYPNNVTNSNMNNMSFNNFSNEAATMYPPFHNQQMQVQFRNPSPGFSHPAALHRTQSPFHPALHQNGLHGFPTPSLQHMGISHTASPFDVFAFESMFNQANGGGGAGNGGSTENHPANAFTSPFDAMVHQGHFVHPSHTTATEGGGTDRWGTGTPTIF